MLTRAWIPEKDELGTLILPSDILRNWARNFIPGLQDGWIDNLDRASTEWCHHDPEMGYLVAKLLCVRFRSRLLQGWRVCGGPGYEGGIADVGLINPKGECIIAVEIGITYPRKFVEGFFYRKFMQLWYFPYHFPRKGVSLGLNEQFYQYKWQRQEVYFVWTRGLRWGEKYPYIDRV